MKKKKERKNKGRKKKERKQKGKKKGKKNVKEDTKLTPFSE